MPYDKILKRVLEYGVLAPSLYNSQPWKFRANPALGRVEVFADGSRMRPSMIDPLGRDLNLALGACVEHMCLAAPAMGFEIKESLAQAEGTPGLTARLDLKPLAETLPEPLFPALLTRQTHAGKYGEGSVQAIHLDRLKHCWAPSSNEKIYFVTEEAALSGALTLFHDLSHTGSADPKLVEECAAWITTQKNSLDGIPLETLGLPVSVKARFALLRNFGARREIKEAARQALLRQGHGIEAPAFLLATTQEPSSQAFFRGGRWLARLALTLSELELGSQSLHLPITLSSGYPALRQIFGARPEETPQFLFRFGSPLVKVWPKTLRRRVEDCCQDGAE